MGSSPTARTRQNQALLAFWCDKGGFGWFVESAISQQPSRIASDRALMRRRADLTHERGARRGCDRALGGWLGSVGGYAAELATSPSAGAATDVRLPR